MIDIFVQLCKNQLDLNVVKELAFHDTRKWRFDYAIPDKMIAIEVEGGAYTGGRHTRGRGFINDMEKYNEATCLGWRLIRVTPDTLLSLKTMLYIKRLIIGSK